MNEPKLKDVDPASYFKNSNKIERTTGPPPKRQPKKNQEDDDFVVDDDDYDLDEDLMQEIEYSQPVKSPASTNGKKKENKGSTPTKKTTGKTESVKIPSKRKAEASSDEDEFKPALKIEKTPKSTPKKPKPSTSASTAKKEAAPPKPTSPKPAAKATSKTTPKASKKKESTETEEDLERKAILESVETVVLPDAAPSAGGKYVISCLYLPRFDYRAMVSRPGPQAPGSKEIPVGNEECLTVLFSPHLPNHRV